MLNIIISGASSGIGRMLAIDYAKKANVSCLFLFARNQERLLETVRLCRNVNNNVIIKHYCFDLNNKDEIKNTLNQILSSNKIDIVIANAGVSAGTLGGGEDILQINTLINTNINGVIGLIYPVINQMKINKSGKVCLISSMASFVGLPSSPTYSATKSFVRIFGDAIRSELSSYNISVSVICPGYIKTPMTDVNKFKMPFLMSVEKASKIIINAIDKKKGFVCFPFIMYIILKIVDILPYKVKDVILSKLPKKSSLQK